MRLPVLIIISFYVILILTDCLILKDLGFLKKKNVKGRIYGIFCLLTLALLTVGVCLPKRSVGTEITSAMWILYIVLTIVISQLIYCIFSVLDYLPRIFRIRKWKLGKWIGFPLALIVFILMWYGSIVGRYEIETNHVGVESSRVPESFDGFKIAQISDLHLGTWGTDTTFVSRLVDSVMNLKPDMIVFTGDAVNRVSDEFLPFVKPLSRLKADYGVYSVLGNHDYGDYVKWESADLKSKNLDNLKKYEAEAGWQMLNNEHITIGNEQGDSIILIGVENWGEPPFSQYGDLKSAYPPDRQWDDNFKILLSHNPRHWDEVVRRQTNIDLTLAGHTHAMQMMMHAGNWQWSLAQYKYPQWSGMYGRKTRDGSESRVYVNIGAGEVGLPMRIGAAPEITLLTLKSSKK